MIQRATGNGQVIELQLGMELTARLPSQEVVQSWKEAKKLAGFQANFAARVAGLLRVVPNPKDLKNKKKWIEVDDAQAFVLDFNGRKHDIKGMARGEFLEECNRLGLSLPIPAEARDAFWKPGKKTENVTPLFPFPMDPHFERQMQSVRTELQWYLENMASAEADQEEDQAEAPSAPETTTPHRNGKAPAPAVSALALPAEPAPPSSVPPIPPEENLLEKKLANLRSLQVREEQELTAARAELEKLPQESMEHGQEMARKDGEIETLTQGAKGLSKTSRRPLEQQAEQARARIRELRGLVSQNDRRCRELPKTILRLQSSTTERAAEIERLETEFLEGLETKPPTPPVPPPPPTVIATPSAEPPAPVPAPPANEPLLPSMPAPRSASPVSEGLSFPTPDIEVLVKQLVGDKARLVIAEAKVEAGKIIQAAEQEAGRILTNAQQQSETIIFEASEKLRRALGILSHPPHAQPSGSAASQQK